MGQPEHEPTVAELVDLLLSDASNRFVLVGSRDEAPKGRAMIFDTVDRSWIRITGEQDGGDHLHRETVIKMLARGAFVTPKV